MIYTVRITSGRETIVIDMIESKVKAEKLGIKTIFHPAEIKGYIFIEGNLGEVQKAVRGVMHVRGLIEKPIRLDEIQRFLEQKKELVKVGIGDTVEIIGGPFKGEKGKINRVDTVKREVTIELLEATIPIPVTIATEFIKIIKSAKVKPEEAEEKKPEEEKPSVFEGISEEKAPPEKPPEKAPPEAPPEEAKLPEVTEKPEIEEEIAPVEKPEEIAKEKKEEVPIEEKPVEEAPVEEKPPEAKPEEEKPPEVTEEKPKEAPEEPERPKSLLEELEEKKKKKKDEEYDEDY